MAGKVKITSTDEEFIEELKTLGVQGTANKYSVYHGAVSSRRVRLEAKLGKAISSLPLSQRGLGSSLTHRLEHEIKDGQVLIGSDAHLLPGKTTAAWNWFKHFVKKIQPELLILDGDIMDLPKASRHDPIGWEEQPEVVDELNWAVAELEDLEDIAGKARLVWPAGNHDLIFERNLAKNAIEFAGVKGFHLKDHFPAWEPCWQIWINDNVQIKHRWKGGDHAGFNNALRSGNTMVTGHDHQLCVRPYADSNGIRWGVQTGTLADPLYGPQFINYTEDNPKSWTPGFILLTFHNGELLWPEQIHVTSKTTATFRGEVLTLP